MPKHDWKEDFNNTRLAKEGGSSWECCDYEGIYEDMIKFIENLLISNK